jgi:6-methylsalicylic acid synthase
VSGYGYGGTIAHVVVEQAPAEEPQADQTVADGTENGDVFAVYPLSGASEAGVADSAARLADWLEGAGDRTPLAAVGHTLSFRRSHLRHRAAVVAADRPSLVEGLRAVAGGYEPDGVNSGDALPEAAPVWVFSGHGSQWSGMGRDLLAREPAFAEVIDDLGSIFAAEIGFTPRQVITSGELDETYVIQPMIFAMQVALAAVWRRYGVEPAAVIGHSVGEIAAAVVAGILDLHDGARLICRRSALLRRAAGNGAMAMVNLPYAEVARRLGDRQDVVAAIEASPTSAVVAGDIAAVDEVIQAWEAEGLVVRRVASDVAFHSRHMDPLLDELVSAAADITPQVPKIPVYSTALDDPRSETARDGNYWAANLRNPVHFASAVTAAAEDGFRVFVELSGHPVVAHSVTETLAELGAGDWYVGTSLRRGRDDQHTLLANLGALHCHGVPIGFDRIFSGGVLADLPTTVWRHRRFWRDGMAILGQASTPDAESHTLLGRRTSVNGSSPLTLWQSYLDQASRPYPGDHPVQGVEIIPAAVLLNTFLTAATVDGARPGLADVMLRTPVSVTNPRELQVCMQDATLRLNSRLAGEETDADEAWLTHTTAAVDPAAEVPDRVLDLEQMRADCAEVLPDDFVIDRLAGIGVAAMGFPWQITELRRTDGEQLLAVVDAGSDPAPTWASVLDAALSIASVVFAGPPILRMPARVRGLVLDGESPARVVIHASVADGAAGRDTANIDIAGLDGRVVATLTGLRYGVLDGDPGATASPRRLVHQLAWRPIELARKGIPSLVVTVGGTRDEVTDAFNAAGVEHRHVADAASLVGPLPSGAAVVVVPNEPGDDLGHAAVRAAWLLASVAKLVAGWDGDRPRIMAVTSGGADSKLSSSPLLGIGRIIAGEHPEIWGGVANLDGTYASATTLVGLLGADTGEDVVRIIDGCPSVARLVPLEGEQIRGQMTCRPDATYLITGGLGALGLEVARWLAGRGARRLLLTGRRRFPDRGEWTRVTDPAVRTQVEAVQALEALGVTVKVLCVDVADRAAVAEALDPTVLGMPPIAGVVHAAGVLDSRLLADLDEDSLAKVMHPKVDGALVLHELFPPGSVEFFALFSSCGYLLGLPGQASYAAANAFLDALAEYRRTSGHDTISLGWTSWRGLGMSTSSELIDIELNARGTADISLTEAFRSWEFTERYDVGHVAVLRMIAIPDGLSRIPILSEITVDEVAASDQTATTNWAAMDPDELAGQLVSAVRDQVAVEIKLDPAELDTRRPLMEMGLDSVMTLVIRRRLEKLFRTPLPATLLWNRPTINAIAEYLGEQLTSATIGNREVRQELPVQATAEAEIREDCLI